MRGVTLKSRAAAFALAIGALVFMFVLLLGKGALDGDLAKPGCALVIAIACGAIGWTAIRRIVVSTATAIEAATDRLLAAARGDLRSPVPAGVAVALPDLATSMENLMNQVQTNLDNVQALASFDQVTGIANRTHFAEQAQEAIARRRDGAPPAALFFVDLDGFKAVNDTLGHAAGDELLARVAARLREVVTAQAHAGVGGAVIGRLAGDEFTLFFPAIATPDAAQRIAHAIQFALSQRFDLGSQQVDLGASIGVALYPEHGDTMAALLRSADIAMYHAKRQGRGRSEMFTEELALEVADRAALERDLLLAIERQEFVLEFQPQIEAITGRAIAAEALLRWDHPQRKLIMPGAFVPVAEESGTIVALGDWVMGRVCATAASWARKGLDQRIAINISTRELGQPDFFLRLRRAMARHHAPARMLELEISESLAMDMDGRVLDQLRALRDEGVSIAIDDFGTGYSNLTRLRNLPIDRVKIDRSLVRDIEASAEARTICSAVVGMIQGLGMEVVVEGIESSAQMEILRVIGCTLFQGYHLARPMPEAEFLGLYGVQPPTARFALFPPLSAVTRVRSAAHRSA
ncbi:MAG: EAL domain-containing protein [Sphingobium sp.]